MRRLLLRLWGVMTSRAVPPVVIGIFLLVYIGIAFFTEETLVTLIGLTSKSVVLALLFALLPISSACRLVAEAVSYLKRRRAMAGTAVPDAAELFDEAVEVPAASLTIAEQSLVGLGYTTRRTEDTLASWRGFSNFPARMVYLAATFCLFAGILISLTSRLSYRSPIVEGDPLPADVGGGVVERISLQPSSGMILSKALTMEVAPANPGEAHRSLGIYPPSMLRGMFVYPRYLGVGAAVRIAAPDLPDGFGKNSILNVYPPGKEDAVEIPGSPYRVMVTLLEPEDGVDPFSSGRMIFSVKLVKGKDLVLAGKMATGGAVSRGGYQISFPETRRLVISDFIRDYGVPLIWTASVLFIVAAALWLPVRLLLPRREMLFIDHAGTLLALSRAEGRGRGHGSIFHEALDLLEAGGQGKLPE
ncbi:MAG TPA: hypothetical protein VI298_02990 [Geobacteraceae bacterium]